MKPHNYFIYSNFDFSRKSAGSTRMRYYAKALASDRDKVYLISCCSDKFDAGNFEEISPNVFVMTRMDRTTNIFDTWTFVRRLEIFAKSQQGGTTFLYYPYPLVFVEIFSLFYLKLIKKRKVFSELNEIPKYSPTFSAKISFKEPKYSIKKMLFQTVFTLMQPLLCFYDGLICISTSMETYARQFNKNTIRIPILTDPYVDLKLSNKNYTLEKAFNLGFSGSIHPKKENLDSFIATISNIKHQGYQIALNLCGEIFKGYKEDFLKICQERDEINYWGYLNEVEMATFLNQQDVLVVPRGFNKQNKYGFSTKLSDYLNHEKVVLVTDVSDAGLYIKDGENGFVVPPNDSKAMFQKLVYIIENFDALEHKISAKALETSREEFHYANYRDKLKNFLNGNIDVQSQIDYAIQK